MGFKFEKLEVWQRAVDLSLEIHTLTRKFSKEREDNRVKPRKQN